MLLAPLLRKRDLFLPFAVAVEIGGAAGAVAMGAGHTFLEQRRCAVIRRQRVTAGVAKRVVALFQAVGDGNALVVQRSYRVPRMRIAPAEYATLARFARASDEAESAEISVQR